MPREGLLKTKRVKIQNQSNQIQNQLWHVIFIKRDFQKTVKCLPGIQKTNKALPEGSAELY